MVLVRVRARSGPSLITTSELRARLDSRDGVSMGWRSGTEGGWDWETVRQIYGLKRYTRCQFADRLKYNTLFIKVPDPTEAAGTPPRNLHPSSQARWRHVIFPMPALRLCTLKRAVLEEKND